MYVESFVSNIIIDLSYSLNKYASIKLFEVGCLHQYTVTALNRLDRDEKLLKRFGYPSNNRAFYRLELNL